MNSERLSPSLSIAFVLFVQSLACRLALLGGDGQGGATQSVAHFSAFRLHTHFPLLAASHIPVSSLLRRRCHLRSSHSRLSLLRCRRRRRRTTRAGASAQNPLGHLCFGQSAVGFRRVWFAPGGSALSFRQKQTKTNQIKSKILIK